MGAEAALAVGSIAHATGHGDLERATLRALAPLGLVRADGLMAEHARWCARCWTDDDASGSPRYMRKVWVLSVVDACAEHGVLLFDRCAKCGSRQPPLGADVPIGFCAHCGEELTSEHIELGALHVDDAMRRLWYAREASLLVHGADVAALLGLSEERLGAARAQGVESLFAHVRARRDAALLAAIARWETRFVAPTIEDLFSVLWSAQFSVSQFLPREVRAVVGNR